MKDELRHIYDISLFNISDLDVLLHEILKQTRAIFNAEAGTIYVNNRDHLKFHVFQNDALSYEEIYRFYHAFKDFKFPLSQDNRYLAVDSFLSKKIIVVDDVYNNSDYDFLGIKEFDAKFKYKTNTIITVPLIHPIEGKILGVVQLLNKKEDDKFVKFTEHDTEVLSMFSSLISLSISKAQNDVIKLQELNDKLKDNNELLESKIQEEIQSNENKSEIIFHQSKMASIGEVMGNIAHQWREPLNKISTIASGVSLNIQLDCIDKEKSSEQLDEIVKTTKNLSRMIDDFKDFYDIKTTKETFNVSSAILEALDIAHTVLESEKVKRIVRLDEKINIYGLKNEFMQSILNLITNSKNALSKNISINDDRLVFIDLFKDKNKVILKVTDNAKGIDSVIANKIFKKDNNTNDFATENGIGLFMTRLIIENHMNGMIAFENISYKYNERDCIGAQFIITLA